jgi:hypothetical protein
MPGKQQVRFALAGPEHKRRETPVRRLYFARDSGNDLAAIHQSMKNVILISARAAVSKQSRGSGRDRTELERELGEPA